MLSKVRVTVGVVVGFVLVIEVDVAVEFIIEDAEFEFAMIEVAVVIEVVIIAIVVFIDAAVVEVTIVVKVIVFFTTFSPGLEIVEAIS